MSGHGIMKWDDGKIYEGEFLNDLKHGEGKLTTTDGKVYVGKWVNGKFHKVDSGKMKKLSSDKIAEIED